MEKCKAICKTTAIGFLEGEQCEGDVELVGTRRLCFVHRCVLEREGRIETVDGELELEHASGVEQAAGLGVAIAIEQARSVGAR